MTKEFKMKPTLYVLVGVPGSGKSTWAKKHHSEAILISTDHYVEKIAAEKNSTYSEVFDSAIQPAIASMLGDVLIAEGSSSDVVWDQTSVNVKSRAKKFEYFKNHRFVAVVFETPPMEELKKRLASRPGKHIPDGVLASMIKNFQEPTLDEGFAEIIHVLYVQKSTWVASDIHMNHLNILQYCPHRWINNDGYSPPTWDDVAEMNEKIISNWNSDVQPGDDVFIIGDVALGQIVKAPDLIRRLNGTKYLIAGNHDVTLKKLIANNPGQYDDLFVWIKESYMLTWKYGDQKVQIYMHHFPHASWPHMSDGKSIHLHGHLHGNPSGVTGRIFDVGIDGNNLHPHILNNVVAELLKITDIRHHHQN
jgi:calcineurin-like phosphoesterase family protein/predicted kinase